MDHKFIYIYMYVCILPSKTQRMCINTMMKYQLQTITVTGLMYICCVFDGNIHIFTTTQRDGPYKKNTFIVALVWDGPATQRIISVCIIK